MYIIWLYYVWNIACVLRHVHNGFLYQLLTNQSYSCVYNEWHVRVSVVQRDGHDFDWRIEESAHRVRMRDFCVNVWTQVNSQPKRSYSLLYTIRYSGPRNSKPLRLQMRTVPRPDLTASSLHMSCHIFLDLLSELILLGTKYSTPFGNN